MHPVSLSAFNFCYPKQQSTKTCCLREVHCVL